MARLSLWHLPITFLLLTVLYLLARQQAAFSPSPPISSPGASSPGDSKVSKPARPATPAGSRLELTLAGNELRYQEAVRERREFIRRIGGPDMPAFPAPNTASYTLWDLYIPAFSCPFPVFRVGVMGDGGKWICGLERATHHKNCVIYSMGVEHQSSFEQAMLHQSEDCQVYGFDFSVSEWGPELLADTAVKSRAHFFPYKIGAADNHTADPKEYSLQGIMKELGHDFVDVWKIDIEGSEFRALKAVIESFKGGPLPFGQMQIEIHVDFDPDHVKTIGEFDAWWSMLEDAGLRPFWTELNVLDANIYRRGPYVGEWSFINIRGKHALLDDALPDHPWVI